MALSYSFLAFQALPRLAYAVAYLGSRADRLVVVGDGLVVLLLGVPGVAAVVVRLGELGVEADRLAVVGDGLVVLLLVRSRRCRGRCTPGELGVEPDRLAVVGDRLVVLLPCRCPSTPRLNQMRLVPSLPLEPLPAADGQCHHHQDRRGQGQLSPCAACAGWRRGTPPPAR